jgi:hypothetical protein
MSAAASRLRNPFRRNHRTSRPLPGISNVTLRMRSYGLYAWLCKKYAEHIGDTDPKTRQRFVRRAEALYALIAECQGSEAGVAGIQWAHETLSSHETDLNFAVASEPGSSEYYLKQKWGAFAPKQKAQNWLRSGQKDLSNL